jgi:hypothetical protein
VALSNLSFPSGNFPGLCAGASLKRHIDPVRRNLARDGFPRLCAGLIEAHSLLMMQNTFLTMISPALCRGLIEAATAVIVGSHAIPDFSRHMRSRVSSVIVGSHP